MPDAPESIGLMRSVDGSWHIELLTVDGASFYRLSRDGHPYRDAESIPQIHTLLRTDAHLDPTDLIMDDAGQGRRARRPPTRVIDQRKTGRALRIPSFASWNRGVVTQTRERFIARPITMTDRTLAQVVVCASSVSVSPGSRSAAWPGSNGAARHGTARWCGATSV
jgi:hypothetical protein